MTTPTILSVDDNFADQNLIAIAFEEISSDCHIEFVKNGEEAFLNIKNKKPDLILLDMNLPRVTGQEVMAQVREDVECKEIPIVFFTGAKPTAEMTATCEQDHTFYVTKPDGIEAFFAAVKAIDDYAHEMVDTPGRATFHGDKLRLLNEPLAS